MLDITRNPKGREELWEALGKQTDEEKDAAIAIMMPAAMDALNRLFQRNLARAVAAGNVTMDDFLYLTFLWEAKLFQQLRRHDFSVFVPNYIEVQDEFWQHLTFSADTDLEQLYSEYRIDDGTERLIWLPDDKRAFLFLEYSDLNFNIGRIRG
jgi:hypothetical protein